MPLAGCPGTQPAVLREKTTEFDSGDKMAARTNSYGKAHEQRLYCHLNKVTSKETTLMTKNYSAPRVWNSVY